MIIIEMILKITGWSQEELANILGVSRVSVNCWLHGNDISSSSKKLISEKFQFPIGFFDVSLDENIEYYKIIYSVLYKNLKSQKDTDSLSDKDKIQDILNRIEIDDKSVYEKEISDEDIIDGLINGYNPFTGEILSDDHLLNNHRVKEILTRIKTINKYSADYIEYDDLSDTQRRLYNKLKHWRLKTMQKEGYSGAYLILSNRTLINIVCSQINDKKDLLHIKGIGPNKYQKYADQIFDILTGEK